MKIRPAGAELSHADGRTRMTKLVVSFRNFANTKNLLKPHLLICYIGLQLSPDILASEIV